MLGLCFSPPPPPEAAKVSFVPIEDRLRAALQNAEHLKEAIRMKESTEQDLRHDISYYKVKNQELSEVLNAMRHSPGQTEQVLRAKAEQNAELSLQVLALRDLLNKSTEAQDTLQKDLDKVKEEKASLSESQNIHRRVMAQIHGLFNTLEKVEVQSIHSEWINTKWMAAQDDTDTHTVQFISRKIIAMEADRQRLLKDNKTYRSEHVQQEERILALERQIRSLQEDKEDMFEENQLLQRELDVRAGKIGALEELFANINTHRNIEGDVPTSVECNTQNAAKDDVSIMNDEIQEEQSGGEANKHNIIYDEDAESVDILSQAAHSVGAAFASVMNNLHLDLPSLADQMEDIHSDAPLSPQQTIPSFHTKDVEQELYGAAMQEAQEWKGRYESLQSEHFVAKNEVSLLTSRVNDLEKQVTNAKKKAEVREGLLREVIQQYKDLEKDHSKANEKLGKLKEKVARLVFTKYKEEKEEKEASMHNPQKNCKMTNGKPHLGGNSEQVFLEEQRPTFDTETSGITMEEMGHAQDDNSSSESSEEEKEKKVLTEDYRRLESECDRLQHEFESAIAKISTLEGELEKARDHVRTSQKEHADHARSMAKLEAEKIRLQEELLQEKQRLAKYRVTEVGQHQDDLRMAELRAEQACSKQREREQDLWDVIEQYKELAELNAEQQAHMNQVERELQLTNRVKIQRRDLVYEYRKMEKALEEAIDTVEQLERDLKLSKSEAARNKEESRSIRKRLAGCHFHYKQLQEQYDVALKQKADMERQLHKAEKYDALRQAQAESWKSEIEDLQGHRKVSFEQLERLKKENEELHAYCEDLLQLTSKAVEC